MTQRDQAFLDEATPAKTTEERRDLIIELMDAMDGYDWNTGGDECRAVVARAIKTLQELL